MLTSPERLSDIWTVVAFYGRRLATRLKIGKPISNLAWRISFHIILFSDLFRWFDDGMLFFIFWIRWIILFLSIIELVKHFWWFLVIIILLNLYINCINFIKSLFARHFWRYFLFGGFRRFVVLDNYRLFLRACKDDCIFVESCWIWLMRTCKSLWKLIIPNNLKRWAHRAFILWPKIFIFI